MGTCVQRIDLYVQYMKFDLSFSCSDELRRRIIDPLLKVEIEFAACDLFQANVTFKQLLRNQLKCFFKEGEIKIIEIFPYALKAEVDNQ